MMELKLSADNDLMFEDGDIVFIPGYSEMIAQNIKVNLQIIKGEWFLDAGLGIPYFEIFGFSVSTQTLKHIFSEAVEEVKGVKKVEEIDVSFDSKNRTVQVGFSVLLDDGSRIKNDDTLELPSV